MSDLSLVFESAKTDAQRKAVCAKINGLLSSKKLLPEQISLRDLAESILGRDVFTQAMGRSSKSGYIEASEAVSPVMLALFLDITGNMIFESAVREYESPEFIWNKLFSEENSNNDGGRDIGLSAIPDDALEVKEGAEFPDAKFGEDYIAIPLSVKRGLKIGITREVLFFDRTGDIIKQAKSIGERLGVSKEKRCLRLFMGLDNTFVRKGVARNTYVSAATDATDPRANALASTPLVDWTTIDGANQLFATMKDDRPVPEPINVLPDTLVVMPSKVMTARRIVNATEIRVGTAAGVQQAYGVNPVTGIKDIVSSPWLLNLALASGLTATQANAYWWYGQPKKAFVYRTLFPFQFIAAQHDKDRFERDVVAQFRADERGVPRVVAPWYNAEFSDT